jgi:DNA-binding GntR family transcriptional regulator
MTRAEIAPLPRTNLKDGVVNAVRTLIFAGDLRPGQKIDQAEICARLGTSRAPLREALIVLDNEGLVETVARRGAFVALLTQEDIIDHYEIYGRISALATERAAVSLTSEGLDVIGKLIGDMERRDADCDIHGLCFEFHRLINQAGCSRRLKAQLRVLSRAIPAEVFLAEGELRSHSLEGHREIYELLVAGDRTGSGEAMARHVRLIGESTVAHLQANGFWNIVELRDQSPILSKTL